MDFAEKKIVITGVASGIGRYMAQTFKKLGATTIVIDKDQIDFETDFSFVGDLAEEAVLQQFSKAVLAKYGKIDYLINNACLSKQGVLSKCNYQDFLYVQKVGVVAPYMLALLFADNFNTNGAIVNISSSRWAMSQPDTESYTAAKGGITALTHGLAVSLANKVRVNAVSPGWIDNYNEENSQQDVLQHPVGRIGKPEDIFQVVKFLCSEESGFITGQNITVDGGMSKLMIYSGENGWQYNND